MSDSQSGKGLAGQTEGLDALVDRARAHVASQPPPRPLVDEGTRTVSVVGLKAEDIADIEAHVRGKSESDQEFNERPPHGWTCFHCGETFKTLGGARLHFGKTPDQAAACTAPPPPASPDPKVEALKEALGGRLFVLSGREGSGAFVKIGFETRDESFAAHSALATLPLQDPKP